MTSQTERLEAIDAVTLFLMRMCEPAEGVLTTRAEFYAAYVLWVDMENERSATADAGHEDDPDWITGEPTTPLRSAVFFGALPTAMVKVFPKAHASRELIDGIPKGQRGFKGVALKKPLSTDMTAPPSTSERGVGMSPALGVGYQPEAILAAMERAFREGYAAGYLDGETPSAEGQMPDAAWTAYRDERLSHPDPYAFLAETLTEAVTTPAAARAADAGPRFHGSEREQDWHEPAPAGMKHIGELDTDGY